MTDDQWRDLLKIIKGERVDGRQAGFIIDSPWLPNWAGFSLLDYFSNDEAWLNANLKAVRKFPKVMFLPGFWSEYGMCTEPAAFGARCVFPQNEFPHAHRVIRSPEEIVELPQPNPKTDGLLPFMLNRLKLAEPHILDAGHQIRFAVARGPLNIASYLMGSTEFLTTMMMEPEKAEALIVKITAFLKEWLSLQMATFPGIDGILLLDDIIGFLGEEQFTAFALPHFKELFDAPVSVKFLHNDAPCRVSAPFLAEMGVNLFNMGFEINLSELKELTGNRVTLLGNLPPRDVLAAGSPQDVRRETQKMITDLHDSSRVIFSCGGGMPPGVTSENLRAFIVTVNGN
jgi:uroporphyrinogen-III decarboxylase